MATSHYKLHPKDLKAPDEFVSTVDRIGNYLSHNLARVVIVAAGLIALTALIFTYAFYRAHRNEAASAQFYDALTALNHKDYRAAQDGFAALAQTGSGELASLARLYAATAALDAGKPAEARDALEAYVADGNQRYFMNLALVQLGVTYEDLGDLKKAHDAYVRAAATPGPEKSRAQLAAARTQARLGDSAGAIARYRAFLTENPLSRDRGEVVDALAALGATPPDSAVPPPAAH